MTGIPYEEPPSNKKGLVTRLQEIIDGGWFHTREQDADGKVGNTLEDLIGLSENSFALPDVGEYELKAKRSKSGSLTSLFHYDPFPRRNYSGCSRKCSPVPGFLLPKFGWQHQEYDDENSFRVTLAGEDWHPRGFRINVDYNDRRVYIEYNKNKITLSRLQVGNLQNWYQGLPSEMPEQIHWKFDDLENKFKQKLPNMVFMYADTRGEGSEEEFNYTEAEVWEEFSLNTFLDEIQSGGVRIDFDARTGHNHGTKFRIDKKAGNSLENLYENKYALGEI